MNNAVTTWFGDDFTRLHPLLQALHQRGGKLSGAILIRFGSGVAGVIGRRLARKLGVPTTAGGHHLDVEIAHDASELYWNRCFDGLQQMRSVFRPTGHWPQGHWLEQTGALELKLKVEVVDGGWHWRVIGVRVQSLPIPLALMPRMAAYKRIEDGHYRFHVGCVLPIFGEVFSYGGLLRLS